MKSIIFCGVGGDGIVTASNICAQAFMRANFDVKKNEIHGMSQRGGAVNAFIVFGKKVYSFLPEKGTVDFMFATEKLEALRNVDYLNASSKALINDRLVPIVNAHIDSQFVSKTLESYTFEKIVLDFNDIAFKNNILKNAVNTIMLGYFSKLLDLDEKYFKRAIGDLLNPKIVDINLLAFDIGRNMQ